MYLTGKQKEVLRVVVAGNGYDLASNFLPCDLDQVIERVDYEVTKHAMHFSIRFLIRKGMIVKGGRETRRGQSRVLIVPTDLARNVMLGTTHPSFFEAEDDPILQAA